MMAVSLTKMIFVDLAYPTCSIGIINHYQIDRVDHRALQTILEFLVYNTQPSQSHQTPPHVYKHNLRDRDQ